MLSQFSREGSRPTLADLKAFEKNVYPVGRLDADSEGLLILTDDKSLNQALLHPKQGHERVYYAQVERQMDKEALDRLEKGVDIRINGRDHRTKPARCRLISDPGLPERDPPIRFRKNVPTSWVEIRIAEGKNRQVRKMTAVVGFPTLRLARWAIEEMTIDGFALGEVREYSHEEIRKRLKI